MSRLALPCAHCGGAFHEPLTLAAKRHRRDPRAVLVAFRALAEGARRTSSRRRGAADSVAGRKTHDRRGVSHSLVGPCRPRSRASRTKRCCAARVASSTTSPRCRTLATRRSCARPSRMRGSAHRRLGGAGATGCPRRAHRRGRGRLSRPFPAGVESECPLLGRGRQLLATPASPSRSSSRVRYVAEDAAELDRLESTWSTPSRPRESESSHERSFSLRRRRGRVRRRRRGRLRLPSLPALDLRAGGVLRRDRRLARRRADCLGELSRPLHAALRRRRRARAARFEAPADHAARLGWIVRDQVVRLLLRRLDRARVAKARDARALD